MRLKISIRMLHYWFEEQKIEHRSKITEEQYEIYGIRYEQYDKDQDHYAVVYDARSLRGFTDYQTIICHKNNMIDNVMLGRYSQTALTGAATVNQINLHLRSETRLSLYLHNTGVRRNLNRYGNLQELLYGLGLYAVSLSLYYAF